MVDQVIGFIRFGVVLQSNLRSFRATRELSVEAALKSILDPSRLSQRFDFLESVCIPSLVAQSDPNFKVYVFASAHLDDVSRERLDRAVAVSTQIEVIDLTLEDGLRSVGAKLTPRGGNGVVTFRLDDDDALGPEYIAHLKKSAYGHEDQVLSAPNGVYVKAVDDVFEVQRVVYPGNAMGLSFVSTNGTTIWHVGNHAKVDAGSMIRIPYDDAWIRSIHGASDSQMDTSTNKPSTAVRISSMASNLPRYEYIDFPRYHAALLRGAELRAQESSH